MTAAEIKFRCSSLGYIMTAPRSKSEAISETAKTHLVDVFVSAKYGRNTDIHNKYTAKGLMVEEDSLTIYSRHTKTMHRKNEGRLQNEFICGTPDIIAGDTVIDIKSSWDIYTFFRSANPDKLNKLYWWQLQGYMALTGATKAELAYCLTDTPSVLVEDQKRRLMWQMNVMDTDENYLEACNEIDKLSKYDDIPMNERIIIHHIERDDAAIGSIYERVKECRSYMNEHLFKVSLQ